MTLGWRGLPIDERIYSIDWSTPEGVESKVLPGKQQQSVCQEKRQLLLRIYK
jgi:hypothetical protein